MFDVDTLQILGSGLKLKLLERQTFYITNRCSSFQEKL